MSKDIKEINIVKSFLDTLSEEHIEILKTVISELQKEKEPAHIPGRYDGEPFWSIHYGNRCEPLSNDTHYTDHKAPRITGSCCKTKEEAEFIYRQQKAYLELIDKIHELNEGWTPDWKDTESHNRVFSYCTDTNEINIYEWSTIQDHKNELYFKDKKTGEQIIEELGDDLIKLALWGIE